MHESDFIRYIHKKLDKSIHAWKINANFANGVPDCWYSGTKTDLWVEYKLVKTDPVRKAPVSKLSALQKNWIENRYREGRNVAVIIGCPSGGIIFDGLTWQRPSDFTIISRKEIINWLQEKVGK